MKRWILTIIMAIIAFQGGALFSFLLTPLLWKLESPLHMELAGHSGPANWILLASGSIASLAGGCITWYLQR
jgi:hypothetical protein